MRRSANAEEGRDRCFVASLLAAVPAFSASNLSTQQCPNPGPKRNDAVCLFNNTVQANNQSVVEAASSLVALVGSVCALPVRVVSQFGQHPEVEVPSTDTR